MAKPQDPYELALKALGYKERTEFELRAWLAERDVADAEMDDVVALLSEAGAIDDASFARRFAADKRDLAGWGPERIARALERRGVERELIDEAVGAEGEEELLDRAVELLQCRGLTCTTDRERDRALGLLVRRGYSLELSYEAVRATEGRLAADH